MISNDNPLWTERYRPKTVEETILPTRIKDQFVAMIEKGSVPNLLLSGRPGIGKTTVALAMLDQLGYDRYVLNGSLEGNIDTLRTKILDFASSVSFYGSRKCVLIDEADNLNAQSTQPALRNFMEEWSRNCSFLFTCNYPSRIIEPLRSRCSVIDFSWDKRETSDVAKAFFDRVCAILDQEGIEYQRPVIGEIIKRHFPDWRRVLNELQRYSARGRIDSGILSRAGEADFKALTDAMRSKNFTAARKWLGENSDMDYQAFYRRFYDHASDLVTDDSVPQLVLIIGEYQYKAAHVADQEVNASAFVVTVMASVTFK